MNIKVGSVLPDKIDCDILLAGVYQDEKKPHEAFLKHEKFEGKKGDILIVNTQGKIPALRICYLGLGKSCEATIDVIRNAYALGARKAVDAKAKTIAVEIRSDIDTSGLFQAITEGLILGGYKFHGFHKKHEDIFKPSSCILLVPDKSKIKKALEGSKFGELISLAECRTRDLVNIPSNKATPEYLASYAKDLAKKEGLKISILDPKREKMECIWAVAKGSKNPPKVVVLEYQGSRVKGQEKIALIGKGITFDSGGISIKPSNMMWEMRMDMSGAAAVIEAMGVIARLKLKKNIVAVVPLCENMPDGGALKPGDVIGSLDGTTVEIISTDAEGRLILADAVTYAKRLGATKIFDCATLTGGCVTALGDIASGLLGNDQEFIDEILEAAEKSGEKMWPLPLYPEYEDYLKSNVADIKNCMDRGMASPSTGATFIKKFVLDTPWVHVDIAGTAHLSKTRGIYRKGATGVPLRTIIEWLAK